MEGFSKPITTHGCPLSVELRVHVHWWLATVFFTFVPSHVEMCLLFYGCKVSSIRCHCHAIALPDGPKQ